MTEYDSSVYYTLLDHNDDFVVVSKQPGITVQSEGVLEPGEDRLSIHPLRMGLLQLVARDLGLEKLYPVHRLDKITSGLVIMAITPEANRQLSMLFEAREVEKFYIALSDKKPKKKQGAIIGDMDKSRDGAWMLQKSKFNPAITQVLSRSIAPHRRLFIIKPHTGKTHQIRVALKSIGAAIYGDLQYGGSRADRGYLHAMVLRFEWRGEHCRYQCLPESGEWFQDSIFIEGVKEFDEPWMLGWPDVTTFNRPQIRPEVSTEVSPTVNPSPSEPKQSPQEVKSNEETQPAPSQWESFADDSTDKPEAKIPVPVPDQEVEQVPKNVKDTHEVREVEVDEAETEAEAEVEVEVEAKEAEVPQKQSDPQKDQKDGKNSGKWGW